MKYFTVKEIADLLSVNEETVRRWIREGKLNAERGAGRQGNKVEEQSLKDFVNNNKSFMTSSVANALGLAASTIGILGGPIGLMTSIPIATTLLGMSLLHKAINKDQKSMRDELESKKLELEEIIMKLRFEISSRENELRLAEQKLNKINEILKND